MRKHPKIPPPTPPDVSVTAGMTQHALLQMKDVHAELAERRIEALRLYEPMPLQDEFHRCVASERIIIGGNRCLAGDQLLWDPYDREYHKVSEIDGWFHIPALRDGKVVYAQAKRPFVKGWDDLYAFRLSNGGEIRCTLNHLVLTAEGSWASVASVLLPEVLASLPTTTAGTYLRVSPEGDPRLSCTLGDSPGDCRPDRRSCDEPLPLAAAVGQGQARKPADAPADSHCCCTLDDPADRREHTPTCPPSGLLAIRDVLPQPSARVSACETQVACMPCSLPLNCIQAGCLSRPLFYARPHTTSASAQPANQSYCVVPWENPLGGNEQVYITACEPLGQGEVWDFEVPGLHNYLIDGVANHNSGKSLSTFVEDARAACGCDPYNKYAKENGNLVIVGRNWPHVGLVIYPMLFKAGAFKIIRDEITGKWRAYRPLTDSARLSETKPAPPLIPPRMITGMSWVLKNAGYLQKVELTNGWTINCFSSEGQPPQGFSADMVHIDEDITNETWIGEMQARLADRKGRFVWSAMPWSKNDALLGLCERAERDVENAVPDPIIKKFTLRFLDNQHIDADEKRKNIERWSALGNEELRMRAEGEFTTESTLMYPSFNRSVHTLSRLDVPNGIPANWTRYVAIDPGHVVMCSLFAAVPPDEKFIVLYDELYLHNCNALIWGEEFEKKVAGQSFRAFIMDMHGGALRDLGSGRLPHELYTEELRKRKIKTQATGHSFLPGSDDIQARAALVRQMLHTRGDGTTRIKILEGSCPNLLREIKRYRKKTTTVNGQVFVTDEPYTRGDVHACQCMEYLCAYEPKYHAPPRVQGPDPWWVKYLADKRRRQNNGADNCVILGPVGIRANG